MKVLHHLNADLEEQKFSQISSVLEWARTQVTVRLMTCHVNNWWSVQQTQPWKMFHLHKAWTCFRVVRVWTHSTAVGSSHVSTTKSKQFCYVYVTLQSSSSLPKSETNVKSYFLDIKSFSQWRSWERRESFTERSSLGDIPSYQGIPMSEGYRVSISHLKMPTGCTYQLIDYFLEDVLRRRDRINETDR